MDYELLDDMTRLAIESTDLTDPDQVAALLETCLGLYDKVRALEGDLATAQSRIEMFDVRLTQGVPQIPMRRITRPDGTLSSRYVGEDVADRFGYREASTFADDMGYNVQTLINRARAMVDQAFKASMVGPVVNGLPSFRKAPRFSEENRLNVMVWIDQGAAPVNPLTEGRDDPE